MKDTIHWTDIEELAKLLLNLDENADYSEVEDALYDKYDASFDSFEQIVRGLIKFTPVVETAILQTKAQGFVHDDYFIVKQEVE